jgi:hypothetical protein
MICDINLHSYSGKLCLHLTSEPKHIEKIISNNDDDVEHDGIDTDNKCLGDECLIKGEPGKSCVELLEKGK